MRNFSDFKKDKHGIVLVALIVIVMITSANILGIIGALMVNRVADALTPFLGGSNTQALTVVTNARNAYIVGIVLVDICLIIYLAVSAQRKESQETPIPGVFF